MRRFLSLALVATALVAVPAGTAMGQQAPNRCEVTDIDSETPQPCIAVGAISFPSGALFSFTSDILGGENFQLVGEASYTPTDANAVIKFTDVAPGTYTVSTDVDTSWFACDGRFSGSPVIGPDSVTITLALDDFITCDFWNGPYDDTDGDGVLDVDDLCPGTVLPDVPTRRLGFLNFAAQGDGTFDAGWHRLDGRYTLADTGGCSGTQIIAEWNLGSYHTKYGIGLFALKRWIRRVS